MNSSEIGENFREETPYSRHTDGDSRIDAGTAESGRAPYAISPSDAEGPKVDISIVVPLFNEEESLCELHRRIAAVMQEGGFSYEIWFVDDGSRDGSWSIINSLAKDFSEVHGIRFRRNYGKSPALNEGFRHTCGRVVVTMDADLQDAPEEIPELYRMIVQDGYDLVSGWKKKRYDPLNKTLPTKLFNATARKVSGIHNLHDFNCGLKAYRSEVVKSIELYNDMHRYIPYLAKEAGFSRIGEKEVKHAPRKYGHTKFGASRFFNGYLDLLTLWFTSRFGRKPMHFFGLIGSVMFLIGFIALLVVLGNKFYAIINRTPAPLVTDRVYFFISLTAMIIGVQLFCAGFIGEMISRQDVHRNDYNVSERV